VSRSRLHASIVAAAVALCATATVASAQRTAATRVASSGDATSLFRGGSFESVADWRAYHGKLSTVRNGVRGSKAARVGVLPGRGDYSIYPVARPVVSTSAGERYSGSASIRSDRRGRRICLRLREWAGTRLVGSAQTCATAPDGWQKQPTGEKPVKGAGHTLDGTA
jgi:hypothetical protein